MKDYQVHDCLSLPSPNFQQLGGVCFGPTNGIFFIPCKQPKKLKSVVNLEILL
jgi:hypothetical protein